MSLRVNFSWTFIGACAQSLSQFLLIVILAKYGSQENLGKYSFGLALTAPIFLFFGLNLRVLQATDRNADNLFEDYFFIRITCSFVALIVILIVLFFADYSEVTLRVVMIIAGVKFLESLSDICWGGQQRLERMKYVCISQLLKGFGLVFIFLSLYKNNDILRPLLIFLLFNLINFILVDLFFIKDILSKVNLARIRLDIVFNLLKSALPLGVVAMLASLTLNIPRYFVEHELGDGQLGIFSALVSIQIAGNIFIGALGQSTNARLSKYHAANELKLFGQLLKRNVSIAGALGLLLVVVAIFFGDKLVDMLFAEEYSQYNSVFVVLCVSGFFNYVAVVLWHALISIRQIIIQTYVYSGLVVIATLTCYLLIDDFGLMGVSVAYLLTAFTHSLFLIILTCIYFKNANKTL